MANWYKDQLTNKNFLSPIGFLFVLEKATKTSFLCQKAEIPDLTLGQVSIPTRGMVPIPVEGNISYGNLNLEFIVDEDLRNYMEIHNWLRALGTPQDMKERRDWYNTYAKGSAEKDARFSDATLQVLNNNNIVNFDVVFKNLFPVSLSTIPFDVTGSDVAYIEADCTLNYRSFTVESV